MIVLTSIRNPLIKQFRKLHQTKHRKAQNLFLMEGTNLLEAACTWHYPLEVVCYTSHWQEKHPQLWENVQQQAQRIELVSPEVLEAIALTKTPDGVSAIASHPPRQVPSVREVKLGLILEQIQDPGNLGTMIRTAAATGVDRLWISEDSVEFDHPKVLRASVGAWFQMPITVEADLLTVIEQFPGQIVATLPTAEKSYWDINLQTPTLLLFGNEGAGLSAPLATLADETVKIPLKGGVESLNVAIAASLILYEAQRQKR